MTGLNNLPGKYWLLSWALLFSLGVLVVGNMNLAVIRQGYYQNLARENKVEETKIPAARGQILDRKGRVLAKSIYQYFKFDGTSKIYQSSGDFQGYKFEGQDLAYDLKRQYTYGESLGLITGYVGMATQSEIRNKKCGANMSIDEVVGRGGIEEYFDCDLRGVDGRRLTEVDARGRYIRELGRQEPAAGDDVNLSIDAYWQEKIYEMLNGRKATVVMSEPKTGKIIAMVSSPGIDSNVFSFDVDNTKIQQYLSDTTNLPMLNRTIGANYHPGSVFKIVMSTGGMESGAIEKNSMFEDTGVIKIGDYSFSNWEYTDRGKKEGMLNVVTAIQKSNDVFFYKLGEKMGVDTIKNWSMKFGYGSKTGVELPGEAPGIVPDDKWKQDNKGDRWYLGDTYHLSIGQGYLSVTPLQVNQSTDIVANNGVKCQMSILKDKKPVCTSLGIKASTLETVKEGMLAACQQGGTAWPLYNFKTKLACKTGTAQVGDGSNDSHAWLTVYAPADNPEIALTVMVERGGEGSDTAAPIAGDILKEWLNEPKTVVPRYTTPTPVPGKK